jgi:hypothetical protein
MCAFEIGNDVDVSESRGEVIIVPFKLVNIVDEDVVEE